MHPFFTTSVKTPALSFTVTTVHALTLVAITDCHTYPEMENALITFRREQGGLSVSDGAVFAGEPPKADDLDHVIRTLQVALAAITSLEDRIPHRDITNLTTMGFAYPSALFDDLEDHAEDEPDDDADGDIASGESADNKAAASAATAPA